MDFLLWPASANGEPFGPRLSPSETMESLHYRLGYGDQVYLSAGLERLLVREGPRPRGKAWKRQGSQD